MSTIQVNGQPSTSNSTNNNIGHIRMGGSAGDAVLFRSSGLLSSADYNPDYLVTSQAQKIDNNFSGPYQDNLNVIKGVKLKNRPSIKNDLGDAGKVSSNNFVVNKSALLSSAIKSGKYIPISGIFISGYPRVSDSGLWDTKRNINSIGYRSDTAHLNDFSFRGKLSYSLGGEVVKTKNYRAPGNPSNNLLDGLVAYYSFDNQDGSSYTHFNTLTPTGTTYSFASGYNGGYGLSGVGDPRTGFFMNKSEVPDLNLRDRFTVSCWYKSADFLGVVQRLFGIWDQANNERQWIVSTQKTAGASGIAFKISGNGINATGVTGIINNVANDTWYHVIAKRDYIDISGISISVNGSSPAFIPVATFDLLHNAAASTKFFIGGVDSNVTGINGVLDHVMIWNRALSDSEMAQVYNSGTPLSFQQLSRSQ